MSNIDMNDIAYMQMAIAEAKAARETGDIPVGALIVDNSTGEVLSRAHNLREACKSATAHAEVLAIEAACEKRGSWRLGGCTLYVTLEPCPMCAGAVVNSRIDRVVYGAKDMLAGCCDSVINFNAYPFNHAFSVTGGVCEEDCRAILNDFFAQKRKEQK